MKEMLLAGVDVSKKTLDIFTKPFQLSMVVSNDQKGFNQWWEQLQTFLQPGVKVLVVMEHTGLYSRKFEDFLRTSGIDYCKIPALEIKRSLGMTRGKNDCIDAERIAGYGWLRREMLTADPIIEKSIEQLKQLLGLRLKIVRDRAGYLNRIREMKAAGYMEELKVEEQIVAFFTQKIKVVEASIADLIASDPVLQKTCNLLRSIKGIGPIIAAYMIANTNNFTRFSNARKFNCYAGIAPFNYQSGSSIKGRSRVSHLANKDTKTLLNLAATCAIRCDEELRTYYHRRIAEGKNKMSCINIVRAKLVARMFAVVKRQSPYQPIAAAA